MEIQLIDTGYFYADGGAMFGAIPKTAWSRRYLSDEHNGCILAMRTLFIKVDDRIVLIDTGAGDKHLQRLAYYRFFDMHCLRDILRDRGVAPEEVTDVVLTHLHFDHCAGCTYPSGSTLSVAFPRAAHWVSRRQWENFRNAHPLEQASFFREDMEAVEAAGLLHLIDTPTALCSEIELRLADGHTPGQLVPYIHDAEETLVFAGDVIPLLASVSPEWISAYDLAPTLSYDAKLRILSEAAECHQRIIFCHDAYALSSRVKQTASGLYVIERDSLIRR